LWAFTEAWRAQGDDFGAFLSDFVVAFGYVEQQRRIGVSIGALCFLGLLCAAVLCAQQNTRRIFLDPQLLTAVVQQLCRRITRCVTYVPAYTAREALMLVDKLRRPLHRKSPGAIKRFHFQS
jgi:hypothetical protein